MVSATYTLPEDQGTFSTPVFRHLENTTEGLERSIEQSLDIHERPFLRLPYALGRGFRMEGKFSLQGYATREYLPFEFTITSGFELEVPRHLILPSSPCHYLFQFHKKREDHDSSLPTLGFALEIDKIYNDKVAKEELFLTPLSDLLTLSKELRRSSSFTYIPLDVPIEPLSLTSQNTYFRFAASVSKRSGEEHLTLEAITPVTHPNLELALQSFLGTINQYFLTHPPEKQASSKRNGSEDLEYVGLATLLHKLGKKLESENINAEYE